MWFFIWAFAGAMFTFGRVKMGEEAKERFTWRAIFGWILFLVIWTLFCMWMNSLFS